MCFPQVFCQATKSRKEPLQILYGVSLPIMFCRCTAVITGKDDHRIILLQVTILQSLRWSTNYQCYRLVVWLFQLFDVADFDNYFAEFSYNSISCSTVASEILLRMCRRFNVSDHNGGAGCFFKDDTALWVGYGLWNIDGILDCSRTELNWIALQWNTRLYNCKTGHQIYDYLCLHSWIYTTRLYNCKTGHPIYDYLCLQYRKDTTFPKYLVSPL